MSENAHPACVTANILAAALEQKAIIYTVPVDEQAAAIAKAYAIIYQEVRKQDLAE